MFEALEMILSRLESCGDAYVMRYDDYWSVTLVDFVGFDEHWSEVGREYVDSEMVEALEELLDSCEEVQYGEGWRRRWLYSVEGQLVSLSYASEDI